MTTDVFIAAVGAWSHRIARTVMFVMFALVPVHFFIPCEASDRLGGAAVLLLLVVGGLSILARRFGPFGWAILATVLNAMAMH